jgi:hypothetical protein
MGLDSARTSKCSDKVTERKFTRYKGVTRKSLEYFANTSTGMPSFSISPIFINIIIVLWIHGDGIPAL